MPTRIELANLSRSLDSETADLTVSTPANCSTRSPLMLEICSLAALADLVMAPRKPRKMRMLMGSKDTATPASSGLRKKMTTTATRI